MSCLTKPDILKALMKEDILISKRNEANAWESFFPDHIGPNSVDLHLDSTLRVYRDVVTLVRQSTFGGRMTDKVIDCREGGENNFLSLDAQEENPTVGMEIPTEGFILRPGVLYLGQTVERTYTPHHVPMVGGRSSTARLGISVHQTAGLGDVGFDGTWTLELSVIHPVRIYPGMRIAQLWLIACSSALEPRDQYGGRHGGRYQGQVTPGASKGHQSSIDYAKVFEEEE